MPTNRMSASYDDDTVEVTATGDGNFDLELTIDTGTTDQEVVLAIDYSQLKLLFIHSDQAITIETNADDATGGQAISSAADVPYCWWYGSGITCPITDDVVTNIFITNASGSTATIKIKGNYDSTL